QPSRLSWARRAKLWWDSRLGCRFAEGESKVCPALRANDSRDGFRTITPCDCRARHRVRVQSIVRTSLPNRVPMKRTLTFCGLCVWLLLFGSVASARLIAFPREEPTPH